MVVFFSEFVQPTEGRRGEANRHALPAVGRGDRVGPFASFVALFYGHAGGFKPLHNAPDVAL
jgi:hypothetical protein